MQVLEAQAVDQARAWVRASHEVRPDAAALRLAGLLRDPRGLAFTVGFIDGVVRPEDVHVAARQLRELSRAIPDFLAWPLRVGMRVAGLFAPLVPSIVVPLARWVLRSLVRHLVIDARPRQLGRAIAALTESAHGAVRLNLNLLGEAILGDAEASRRVQGTLALIERTDVDYVSIKVSSTVAPHSPWAFDAAVAKAVDALRPLFVAVRDSTGGPTFINLDMEEYRDLALTVEVFTTLLDDPELASMEAGIVLQAYLPDALAVMVDLQAWAARRVEAGGAPIKVRVVKGANLPMERVDADHHGWALATWGSKAETDANYKAMLAYALRPERVRNVRIGVAGHNLFDLALAWELAGQRGVRDAMDVEMLIGMAPQQTAVIRETVGQVLLYTPTVRPREFDVAIAYLIRRLDEGASAENFMSAVFDLSEEAVFERERERFSASLAIMPTDIPAPHRRGREALTVDAGLATTFVNTADTDPAVRANIEWADAIRARMGQSTLGIRTAGAGWVDDPGALDELMTAAAAAGEAWGARPAAGRAAILRRAAIELERRRGDLIEVAGAECGKVVEQTDPEVSEAIDFALYYAASAEALEHVDGAQAEPMHVTVVTPPWNFPVAIPAGGVLAALAAGSAVVLKPSEEAARCSAVVAEALWEAGVPRDVLHFVRLEEHRLGERLIAHPRTDQVILTGAYETAELFRSFKPDLRLLAETSGKNAIIVTPSADLDLAAKDVAVSAFGHAGQKCSAASLVVLVGSVATSRRFRAQLVDAVTSLAVGSPLDAMSQVGPLIAPASGKLERALTTLEPGQSWLVKPRQLDDAGALWSPGIRTGVLPGSEFHTTEYFGPVLGVMEAATLDEAIGIVNAVDYGLTSGLHSLDSQEIQHWLARIEAGNLYVNRSITGAIVQRQPFGGWKRSTVGTGTKAGGPHYVASLTRWRDASADAVVAETDELGSEIDALARSLDWDDAQRRWLAGAWATDAVEWNTRRGIVSDPTGLDYEINAQRYHPVPVAIRAALDGDHGLALLRVLGAGVRAGSSMTLSTSQPLPAAVQSWVERHGISHRVDNDDAWADAARALSHDGRRVRLVGLDEHETLAATGGSPALAVYAGAVVTAGAIEMQPFVREQAVSVTAHRFGAKRHYDVPIP
jgi:RHH-type proline utilization regulon transcriptional repressor/proline dehydrogenase/delta 1-pyrroline-5-carboxylate dehydrogenase